MARVITLASGKGGVGKSLGHDEYVSLANGAVVQIGPFVDRLIAENKSNVRELIFQTVDGRQETFEVLAPPQDLLVNAINFNEINGEISSNLEVPVALMRKPAPDKLIKISCPSGSVSVTPEHKFIVMRHGSLQKTRADEIREKEDYLVSFSPKEATDFSIFDFPEDVAELLGYLIGDGYMDGYLMHVFCADNDMLPRIRESFSKVFGRYSEGVSRNLHRISFYRRTEVSALYEKYGVKIGTAEWKEVPEKLFISGNNSISAFLRALFDCDGTVNVNRREVEFDSKSKKLVYQVASLLRLRFGISSQISSAFKIAKNGKMKEKAEYWRLLITGKNAAKYLECIGFKSAKKLARLKEQITKPVPYNTNIDVYPVGKIIKKIRELSGISAPQIATILGCTKQLVYEYEREWYAMSKETVQRYLLAFEKLGVTDAHLDWLKQISESDFRFARVSSVECEDYDMPYVYDFQIGENGGHFLHSSGIVVSNTTIAANLGIALAQRGLKVCLVDADVAMANLSLLLGMQSSPITLHDVLLGQAGVEDAIYDGPSGIKLIPSGLSLENYRRVDSERLIGVIDKLRDLFDFVILDAPAGIEKNVLSAVSAADEIILVTMPESPSIADVLKMKITAQRLNVRVTGIITNFARGEKGEISNDDIVKMLELPSYGVVPFDDEVRRSFMQEKPVPFIIRKPNCPAAVAIRKTAAKLSGGKEIASDSAAVQTPATKPKGESFFAKLFAIFRRK